MSEPQLPSFPRRHATHEGLFDDVTTSVRQRVRPEGEAPPVVETESFLRAREMLERASEAPMLPPHTQTLLGLSAVRPAPVVEPSPIVEIAPPAPQAAPLPPIHPPRRPSSSAPPPAAPLVPFQTTQLGLAPSADAKRAPSSAPAAAPPFLPKVTLPLAPRMPQITMPLGAVAIYETPTPPPAVAAPARVSPPPAAVAHAPEVEVDLDFGDDEAPSSSKIGKPIVSVVVGALALAAAIALAIYFLVPRQGSLEVDLVDGDGKRPRDVAVLVDGEPKCASLPCVVAHVEHGRRLVEIDAPGFEAPPPTWMEIEGGHTRRVRLSLKPIR